MSFDPHPAPEPTGGAGDEPAARYRDALLAGDGPGAQAVLEAAGRAAEDAVDLLEGVIAPALREVGRLWETGHVTVAEEHVATQWVGRHLEEVRFAFRAAPDRGATVVVGTVEGEGHVLPARMAADALELDGWEVAFLGGGLPADAFAAYAAKREARLVAVSVTMAAHLPALRALVGALRTLDPPPALLIGGAVVRSGDVPGDLDVDATYPTLRGGVEWARRCAPADPRKPVLETWLAHVGEEVRRLRGRRGWSQSELASRARLPRAHVAAVEEGRENLTMDALLELADALGVPPAELLRGTGVPGRPGA